MRTSRRFQIRLAPPLSSELETFALRHGLGLSPAIRLLVRRGLDSGSREADMPQDSAAALASLTAAEHAVLMVASVLPEGERHMRSLGERAVQAAEERLALFRPQATDSQEQSP